LDAEETLRLAKRRLGEGRPLEAAALCRETIAAQPDLAEAENLLGVIAAGKGDIEAANAHFSRAVALAPAVAMFHANLSEALRLSEQPELGLEAARRALEIEPNLIGALINLGAAHYELRNFEEAALAYRKAVAASPNFAPAHTGLGNVLFRGQRVKEAIPAYRRAIEINPLAAALRSALALAPNFAGAHVSLSSVLLARGDFGEGWEEHEWRLRRDDGSPRSFPKRPWRGESLAGKHIYVGGEAGFGDMLQFARYVPLVAMRAAQVTLRVPWSLTRLMHASFPGVAILTQADGPVPYDCDVALLSLAYLFKTRLETIPATVPYLRPPAEVATRWRNRLAGLKGLKVGLVWAGNPDHDNDGNRSIGLAALRPLLTLAGVSFVSLQYGPRAADLQTLDCGPIIEDLSPELNDFSDTAGAVLALDLVVSVDTSVAHLAGGLAKPVWLLAPCAGDWRWMFEVEDSPWYPTMRLFRQRHGETWGPAVGRLLRELSVVARGDASLLTPFKASGDRRAAQAAEIIALESERIKNAASRHQRDSERLAT
jgi:Flp pilus assembly protein TadD